MDRFLCAVRRFARYAFLACAFFLGGAGLVAVAGRERVAPSTPSGDRTDDGGVSAGGARTEGRRRGRGTECGFSRRRSGEREYNRIVQYCAEGRMGAVAVLGVQRLRLLLTWSHDGKKVFVFFFPKLQSRLFFRLSPLLFNSHSSLSRPENIPDAV